MTLRQVLERHLGRAEISGDELIFICPKCSRKKLGVNAVKRLFNCFRCKWGGHLSEIIAGLDKYAPTVTEAVYKSKINVPDLIVLDGKNLKSPLLTYLRKRGMSTHRAVALGVCCSPEFKYKNRVFIPVGPEAWVGRAIDDREPKELFFGDRPKGEFLYQTDPICDESEVVVTEGIFDAESVRRAGYIAVAIMGSSISDHQVGLLIKRRPDKIMIMLDQDEVGKGASWKVLDKISKRYGGYSHVVRWSGPCKDPGEMSIEAIRRAIDV